MFMASCYISQGERGGGGRRGSCENLDRDAHVIVLSLKLGHLLFLGCWKSGFLGVCENQCQFLRSLKICILGL